MAKKLAITFSGAVSLGSYEAGVLYEVLYALGQHNSDPAVPERQKVYVDVLTGASAGGLSVSVAAQKLLYEADSLENPYDNPLYRAWVTDIDIDGLLNFGQDEQASYSVFSSNLIDKLADKYILGRYDTSPLPPPKTHASIGSNRTLQLGLALSNLCGVDYTRDTLGSGRFTYTRFQDELTKKFGIDNDSREAWSPIQKAAVSCGAFPFAFRVQDLERDIKCYNTSKFFDPASFGQLTSRAFTYTDGGVFQNEPLGLAKNLVDGIDNHQNSDQRAYLFVAPDPKTSSADGAFSAKSGDFSKVAARLVAAIFNQARFQDWIEAEHVNEQIELFNSRAMGLHAMIKGGTLRAEAMHPVAVPLLAQFFGPDKRTDLAAARLRLQQQFSTEYAALANGPGVAAADSWIDSILIFETAANLHDKDEMYIYSVTAKEEELAGSALMAFLGFFDQGYRDHDYDVGRTKAQLLLQNPTAQSNGPLPALRYTPKPVRKLATGLTGLSIKQASEEKRKQLRDRLRNRANILLTEAGLPFLVREGIELAYVNKKIDDFLGL